MLPTEPKRLRNGAEPGNGASPPALAAASPIAGVGTWSTEHGPAPVSPSALGAPPSFTALVHVCRRRWRSMLGLGVLGATVAMAGVWLRFPAKYMAQTLIHISTQTGHAGSESEADFTNFQRTQAALLKSQTVLRAALEKPEVADLREVRAQSDAVAGLQKSIVTDTNLGPEILHVTLTGEDRKSTRLNSSHLGIS